MLILTYSVRRNGLQPVIVQIEQDHLWLSGLQNEIPKLLHLQTSLEGQLQLRAFNDNVGEIQQMHLDNDKKNNCK